ncbi:hypothetical protein ACJJTC_000709 [Scirpophaga incertulas]
MIYKQQLSISGKIKRRECLDGGRQPRGLRPASAARLRDPARRCRQPARPTGTPHPHRVAAECRPPLPPSPRIRTLSCPQPLDSTSQCLDAIATFIRGWALERPGRGARARGGRIGRPLNLAVEINTAAPSPRDAWLARLDPVAMATLADKPSRHPSPRPRPAPLCSRSRLSAPGGPSRATPRPHRARHYRLFSL